MSDPTLATACDFRHFLSSVEAFYETKNTAPHAMSSAPSDSSLSPHPSDEAGAFIYPGGDTPATPQASAKDMPAGLSQDDVDTFTQTPAQTLARTSSPEANVSFQRHEQDGVQPQTVLRRHDTDPDTAEDRSGDKVIYRYSREFLIHFRSHGVSPSTMGGITAAIQQAAATKSPPKAQTTRVCGESSAPEVTWQPDESFAMESQSRPTFISRSIQARRSTGSATGALSNMARVSTAPADRPEVIQSLIDGVDRYNPDNVSILEEYLATQCSSRKCDAMANLAILKLYQFNPHLTNDQVVNNILVKALTTLPEPDFNLCLYLLNEQVIAEEPVVRLVALQDMIEQARFPEFWKIYEGDDIYKELTAEVLGFEDAMRANIANVVAMTFQLIESASLGANLNLKGEALSEFVKAEGWTEASGVITIPVNKDNEAKATVLTENIKFERKLNLSFAFAIVRVE
ncbi:hypothetical protein BGZ70_007202 [Mortierella alpina]|uniref:Eukaryotic translation initiation factor 3 subunit K n=1 Tax=Mortierella alpina TaxID=64518 RepID=A0A9P6M6W4_MORAP|nr:hypothetical protein BGZ70_007202 [Mortierella alpina]